MQKSWANSNDLDRSNKVAWDLGFLAHFLSNTTKPRTGSTATCLNLSLFTQGSGGKFFNNTHCEVVLYFYLDYLWTFPQTWKQTDTCRHTNMIEAFSTREKRSLRRGLSSSLFLSGLLVGADRTLPCWSSRSLPAEYMPVCSGLGSEGLH